MESLSAFFRYYLRLLVEAYRPTSLGAESTTHPALPDSFRLRDWIRAKVAANTTKLSAPSPTAILPGTSLGQCSTSKIGGSRYGSASSSSPTSTSQQRSSSTRAISI